MAKLNGNILNLSEMHLRDIKYAYFKDIEKNGLLTKEEELSLMIKAKDGDIAAYQKIVSKNLRLVVQIALKYNSPQFGLMDRISEGNLGLIHAIEKFDISKGYRFSTYAHWWIKQSIERGIMNQGRSVRLPVHVVRILSKFNKTSFRLSRAKPTSINEVAKEMDCDPKYLHQVLSSSENALHYDTSIREESKNMLDIIPDSNADSGLDNIMSSEFLESVLNILCSMAPYEHFIIVRHLGLIGNDRNTLQEISDITGFTREQVRNREQKAIEKLRLEFNDK